ncbi:propanediol utilization protein PduV [Klebsiella pneumoniae]|uniref:Propanediol utilization protein PduV n=1 Tax=Klebsiella pneumoniae TaxID=573 RepID=A0A377WNH8_KLEPN|nr:propanediol utilization protein PduV [Klebsiella pneumoniae]
MPMRPGHLFSPGFTAPMNRPVIGVITKADLAAPPRLQQVRTWLETAGAGHIFITSALTGDGLDDLFACLNAEEYQ